MASWVPSVIIDVICLQAVAAPQQTRATRGQLWPGQVQAHGEQETQRPKCRQESLREGNRSQVSSQRGSEPTFWWLQLWQ